jgi:hypothetical protein
MVMKKVFMKLILALNALVWIIVSSINYIGIMQQLNNDIMRIFLWSIFTATMYVVVIYSITLGIKRVLVLHQYKDNNIKYISNRNFVKQLLLLGGIILYLYGACYVNSIFLGLLPMLLFFSNTLIDMGRLYIYEKDQLLMFEDISKEYQVIDFDLSENKLSIEETGKSSHKTIGNIYIMDEEENKFLSGFFVNKTVQENNLIQHEVIQDLTYKEQEG